MTRNSAREFSVRLVFESDFHGDMTPERIDSALRSFIHLADEDELYRSYPSKKQIEYIHTLVEGIWAHLVELDGYIEKYSEGWDFERIPRVIIAVMRVAMFEMLYMPDIPNGVAINEAVEISKGYVDDKICAFVNGVLSSFVKTELIHHPEKPNPRKVQTSEEQGNDIRN